MFISMLNQNLSAEDMNQSTDEDEFHDYEPYDNEAADAKLPQNIVLDACKCDVNRYCPRV